MKKQLLGLVGACALVANGCGQAADERIIELGDGRFQLALDPAVGTQAPAWLNGVIEWEYVGQATYVRPERRGGSAPILTHDGPATDTLSRLLSSTMEDEHGRLFRPRAVDSERLQAAIAAYEAKVARDFGLEGQELTREDGRARDAAPQGGIYTPLTWSRTDQDGDGDLDRFLWDADDRGLVSEPLTERQKKAVVYFFGDIGEDAGMCSGMLIGDYWVLTAAHCTKDSTGTNWIYAEDTNPTDGKTEARRGKVCVQGNYYSGANCANVTGRWGNGEYTGSGDMGDDLVIMKLDEPLGLGNYMALSSASDSTLKSNLQYNLGHPGLTPSGADNSFNCGLLALGAPYGGYEGDSVAPCESKMYWSADDATFTSDKVLGTRIDMSAGHSGGGIFYYPDGVSASASHFLTGVVSGHHNGVFENYNGGPKVPYHRDWILGIMSAH